MENICDYKNCKKIGQYKAPIEKDNSKKFRWLCLDHIKEFNQKWDYFKLFLKFFISRIHIRMIFFDKFFKFDLDFIPFCANF